MLVNISVDCRLCNTRNNRVQMTIEV